MLMLKLHFRNQLGQFVEFVITKNEQSSDTSAIKLLREAYNISFEKSISITAEDSEGNIANGLMLCSVEMFDV